MRVVVTHTEFRLYWLARLRDLERFLQERGAELIVVEVAGRGSPHEFAGPSSAGGTSNWVCLFQDVRTEELSAANMSMALWKTLERLEPDVVLATGLAFPPGATGVRWCRERRRPIVIMDNARMEDVPRSPIVNYVKAQLYRNVDAVLLPAASHVASFSGWGIDRKKMFFGLNVLDNEWFASQAQSACGRADALRQQYNLPERFFLGIGRQIAKKNWTTLIDAYGRYRHECHGRPWHLVLVGQGPERPALAASAEKNGVADIRFVPFVEPQELCVYYSLAGALVLPSFHGETWGLVVNEAMACGLPVIVSDQCGCCETLVCEGENGWPFGPTDTAQLANIMTKLACQSETQLQAMGDRSRDIIADWPLGRFAEGVWQAIEFCRGTSRGYDSLLSRALLSFWKGRYQPN